MFTTTVKKMIARNGEREIVDSSQEEKQQFIVERQRPDFEDDTILCIKFLVSVSGAMETAEESSWFINPFYAEKFSTLNFEREYNVDDTCCSYESEFLADTVIDDNVAMEFASTFGYSPCEAYGPKMASEFLPEILVLQNEYPNISMLSQYQEFYGELLKHSLSNATFTVKLMLFCKYLKCDSYSEKSALVPNFLKSE